MSRGEATSRCVWRARDWRGPTSGTMILIMMMMMVTMMVIMMVIMMRTYFRRTEGIREWGKLVMDCVKRKKDEFERDMSPCDLLRYPRWG